LTNFSFSTHTERGQGLNHSLTDAGKLVSAITSLPLNEAISTYEKEMKERAGEEVRVSVMNTAMLHDWNKVMESPVFRAGLKLDSNEVVPEGE
jgi:2-polyprenyl-6-methoxyphenol hydroxylase-like FAD-dependent oxidoreductase